MKRNLEPLNSAVISKVRAPRHIIQEMLLPRVLGQYQLQYSNLCNNIIYLGHSYISIIRVLSLFFEKNKISKIVLYKGVNFWSIFNFFSREY